MNTATREQLERILQYLRAGAIDAAARSNGLAHERDILRAKLTIAAEDLAHVLGQEDTKIATAATVAE